MITITKPERQAELEALKHILLGDERDSIETLRRALKALDDRVGDDDRFRNSVTRVLVAAFREAEATQHRELAEALSPLVLAGIRREIMESRDLVVEALYPITGRLVATAVSRAFHRLVVDINAKLEAVVSPTSWRRRLKSLLTGRSMAEIILAETAGFQLERILLIDRATGSLLATWAADEEETPKDEQTALMGGLLSAIVSFSRDAFEGDGHDLRALDMGDRVVILRSSARRIVAAVGRGVVDHDLEARADNAFLSFLELSSERDSETTTRALLASLVSTLTPPAPEPRSRTPVPLLVVVALLLAAGGYWGVQAFEARRAEQRLDAALAALGERMGTPGAALALVRDGQTRTVRAVGLLPSERARRDLEDAIARELPGHRLEAQIVTATGGPASLDVTMGVDANLKRLESAIASLRVETERGLKAAETQVTGNLNRLESAISSLRVDTEQGLKSAEALVTSEADRLRTRIDEATSSLREARTSLALALPNYAVFFAEESEYRSPAEAERDLDAIAALLKDNPGPKIRLIGYGDAIGSRATNLKIALARAQKVAADLLVRGIDQTRLVLAARDGSQEIAQYHGVGSPNRRVTFEVAYIGE